MIPIVAALARPVFEHGFSIRGCGKTPTRIGHGFSATSHPPTNSEYFGNSNLARLRDILSLLCPALRPQSLVLTNENGFLNES
jgi:hypothetical protein